MKAKFLIIAALAMLCACQKAATGGDDSKQELKTPAELILGKWSAERMDQTTYVLSSYYSTPDNRKLLYYENNILEEDGKVLYYVTLEFTKDGKLTETMYDGDGTGKEENTNPYKWFSETQFWTNTEHFSCLGSNNITVEKISNSELVLFYLIEIDSANQIDELRLYLTKM